MAQPNSPSHAEAVATTPHYLGDAKTMKATAACLPLHDASAQDAETISAKTRVGNKTMQSTTFYFTEFANLHRLCGEPSLFSCLSVPIL